MQKKLPLRILASLILSVMLFALPIGAFFANRTTTVQVFAEEEPSGESAGEDGDSADTSDDTTGDETGDTSDDSSEDASGDTGADDSSGAGDETGDDSGDADTGDTGDEDAESETEETPVCTCSEKCGQYDYDKDCPVCSADYKKCEYKDPSVKITINTPSGWYSSGSTAKVTFTAEDILDTGNFAIKSVKAKIGQNGSYQDVTEDMYLEISENCTVYVLVTDANDKSYERSRSIKCFDTTKPTLNAAVSDGLLTVQAVDNESGIKVIYVNGYEFTDGITNGTLNIRLSKFDAGYEYFTITAMDNAGNVSEVYKTKNPYYKDPESDDDSDSAEQLPTSAQATNPSSATATVTEHTKTDSDGNTVSQTPEQQKKEEFARADAEEASLSDAEEQGEDMNLGKEFYTIEAASGKVFYLIIDRDGEEEVVYFLTEITENDLLNVTTDNSETLPKNSAALESQIPVTESALPNNNTDYEETKEVETPAETPEEKPEEEPEPEPEPEPAKSNPLAGYLIMGIFGAAVIGAAYYFKVIKKKQEGDFVEDEEEEDDEEYESESEESESDESNDFFESTEKEEEEKVSREAAEETTEPDDGRPVPTEEDAAETVEGIDADDPYESDSEEE